MGFEPFTGSSAAGGTVGLSAQGLGLAMLTYSPLLTTSNTAASDGQMFWNLVTAATTQSVSHLGVYVFSAGVTAGVNPNRAALYSEAGVLLATSSDLTAAIIAASNSWVEGTCPATAVVAGANYYLAIVTSFSGTTPHLYFNGGDNIPALNGHYMNVFLNSQASVPASFTPSAASTSFANMLMYAR